MGALATMLHTVVAAQAWTTVVAGAGQKRRAQLAASPNPFEPLIELLETGYALEAITARHLVLASPRRRPRFGESRASEGGG